MRLIPSAKRSSSRHYSSALYGPLHFYRNKQLDLYASRNATPLTLRQLVRCIVTVERDPSNTYGIGLFWEVDE